MKNRNIFFTLTYILFLTALTVSCNQDSIFADISVEPEPKDPRIEGSPVPLVEFDGKVWTAGRGSGKLHYYGDKGDGSIGWRTQPSPGGSVVSLGATTDYLYVLTGNPVSGTLWKVDPSGNTEGITSGLSRIQTIYTAGNTVFAGRSTSADNKTWSVYYAADTDSSLNLLMENTGMLTGAAVDGAGNIYISTLGKGVFKFDFSTTPPTPGRIDPDDGISPAAETIVDKDDNPITPLNVRGIMNTGIVGADSIVAVTSNGYILWYDDVNSRFKAKSQGGPYFSGAMALWKRYDDGATSGGTPGWIPALLLLGVRSGGTYNKGYREIDVDLSGIPLDGASPVQPGSLGPPAYSSIARSDRSKYEASLYKYSVVSIIQVSDAVEPYPRDPSDSSYVDPSGWQPLILASTVNAGLQSLENGLWNAEE